MKENITQRNSVIIYANFNASKFNIYRHSKGEHVQLCVASVVMKGRTKCVLVWLCLKFRNQVTAVDGPSCLALKKCKE